MNSTLSPRALEAQLQLAVGRHQGAAHDESNYKILDEEFKLILDRYPHLFAKPNIGLGCGAGWWPALEDAFIEITGILNTYVGLSFNTAQIKEKFGGLRFYYDLHRKKGCTLTDELEKDAREAIDAAVQKAENMAGVACEVCGQRGVRGGKHWLKTLCETHMSMHDR